MGTVKKLYQDQLVGGSGSAGQEVYPVTSTLGVYDTDNNQLQGILDKVTTNLGLFTCGTAAATAAKTVSASKFVLMEGGSVKIKFTYANSADSPTLAIGSTAAKPIMFNGSAASASNSWEAGEVVEFYYDGTNWVGRTTTPVTKEQLNQLGQYVENPEFVEAHTDSEGKVLYGVKKDGNFHFGAGVPSQIDSAIDEKLEEGLETKVDKDEGKSLIDADYAASKSAIENPEYLDVTLDAEDKVLEGIQRDGTKVIGGDLNVGGSASISGDAKILGSMEVSGASYKVIENPEYLAAWLDAEGKVIFGLKTDGKTYVGDADFLTEIKNNKEAIVTIQTYLANFNSLDIDALTSITTTENPEYIEVKTDKEGKIIAGRTPDGAAFENVGFATPKVSIDSATMENIEDSDGRTEIITDSEGRIISYRKSDGVKHEEVGVETPVVNTDSLKLTPNGMSEFQKALNKAKYVPTNTYTTKEYRLPKFGHIDIATETFYLTANEGYSTKDDIEVRQDLDDSDANARAKLTIAHYYIKNTDTKLDFYAATKVTAVGSKYYVTDSLVDGQVVPESIEVTQIVDKPDVRTWPVDKKTEHNCVVNINFGDYLNGSFYIGVKFQGSSTLEYRKRNFRFTFYKNSSYAKKNKIKIGEFIRTSGYNLKANWTDDSKVKELVMNNIFMAMWEDRDVYAQYPWNKDYTPNTDATGMIKGFPVEVKVGGAFYGLDIFGLKKDERNYLLDGDDDASGIFVSCDGFGGVEAWTVTDASIWVDEMEAVEPMSQETIDALNTLFDFINDRLEIDGVIVPFNKFTAPERIDVIGFIDYFICLQVFQMWDNGYRNMILYSGKDKKKFYPYMYDLDLSLNRPYNMDFFDMCNPQDPNVKWDWLLWDKMVEFYWDEIVNRYRHLRNGVLNDEGIDKIFHNIVDSIPDSVYTQEYQRWNKAAAKSNFISNQILLSRRFEWLDKEYFKL